MNTFLKLLLNRKRGPNNSIRLYLTKRLINSVTKAASKRIPKTEPRNMNSLILSEALNSLSTMVQKEYELVGTREGKNQDRNFQELIDAIFKAAIYLSETDPYYELWLGELLKQISENRTTHYFTYAQTIMDNVKYSAAPECNDLVITQEFTYRAFNLKTCGGLQLLEEQILTQSKQTEKDRE